MTCHCVGAAAGGCVFFGDEMPPQKLAGVGLAMAGIVWYTQVRCRVNTGTPGMQSGQHGWGNGSALS